MVTLEKVIIDHEEMVTLEKVIADPAEMINS